MNGELFNEPAEEYVLFSSMTRRIILRQSMNEFTAEMSNHYYQDSLCGHLKWVKASELKVRTYTVKR